MLTRARFDAVFGRTGAMFGRTGARPWPLRLLVLALGDRCDQRSTPRRQSVHSTLGAASSGWRRCQSVRAMT